MRTSRVWMFGALLLLTSAGSIAARAMVQGGAGPAQAGQTDPGPALAQPVPVDHVPPAGPAAKGPGDAERGRYIVQSVAMCFECHSGRDALGNIVPSQMFMGSSLPFEPPWPNDWVVRAPRIYGLPGYTDELAVRLLTNGAIDRNGVQLRRPMPRFQMTPEDAADVVRYLKSLP